MNYGELRGHVKDALGRDDVPLYIYELVIDDINNDVRVLEMQAETTLIASGESVTLPSDFLSVESLYIDTGGIRTALVPITEQSQGVGHDPSGRPYYYAVHDTEITLMPVPDTDYTLTLRYYTKLADLSSDSDTNPVMQRYRGLFIYSSLTHAAIWSKNEQDASTYSRAYKAALDRTKRADRDNRFSGPMTRRTGRW